MGIKERVQEALNNTDLSTTNIATYMDMDDSTIYRWKAGKTKRFDAKDLRKLAEVLRIDYEWLQYGEKDENTKRASEPNTKYSIDELLKEERSRFGISDIPDDEMGRAVQDILDDAVSLVLKLRRLAELNRKSE